MHTGHHNAPSNLQPRRGILKRPGTMGRSPSAPAVYTTTAAPPTNGGTRRVNHSSPGRLTVWFNNKTRSSSHSWSNNPYHTTTDPDKHGRSYQKIKQRIFHAVSSVLGAAASVAHEALFVGADLLQFVPVPALDVAGRTLLNIWDAVDKIQSNRKACLRLAGRCAEILLAVREEIGLSSTFVAEELREPVAQLQTAFEEIDALLQKQLHRPFYHRYIKRDDIQRNIAHCNTLLDDALELLGFRVQRRMLEIIKSDTQSLSQAGRSMSSLFLPESFPIPHDPIEIRDVLARYKQTQNLHDLSRDMDHLRQLLHNALDDRTASDAAILELLQVNRDEMRDAIGALQGALRQEASPEPLPEPLPGQPSSTRQSLHPSPGSHNSDLDEKFIEKSLAVLTRISDSSDVHNTNWHVTFAELTLHCKIGASASSDVFSGQWRERIVTVKVLTEATRSKLFMREIRSWRKLDHPNVLELLGSSSPTGGAPHFLISAYYQNGSLVQFLRNLGPQQPVDMLVLLRDIAAGMLYLHCNDVVHGSLKASNVLVDDFHRCVVSDFGQREVQRGAFDFNETSPMSYGMAQWQSPELLMGTVDAMTPEVDVYAFGMTSIEVFTRGTPPWPGVNDDGVRHCVCALKKRPSFPDIPILQSASLRDLIQSAWRSEPHKRCSFLDIVQRLDNVKSETMYHGARILWSSAASPVPQYSGFNMSPQQSYFRPYYY